MYFHIARLLHTVRLLPRALRTPAQLDSCTKVCYNGVGEEILESDEGIFLGSVVSPPPCEEESVLFFLSSQAGFITVHFTQQM